MISQLSRKRDKYVSCTTILYIMLPCLNVMMYFASATDSFCHTVIPVDMHLYNFHIMNCDISNFQHCRNHWIFSAFLHVHMGTRKGYLPATCSWCVFSRYTYYKKSGVALKQLSLTLHYSKKIFYFQHYKTFIFNLDFLCFVVHEVPAFTIIAHNF